METIVQDKNSFSEIRAILKDMAEKNREADERMQKNEEQMRLADEQLRASMLKTDEQMRKTDEQMRKTDRKLKELGIQIGGLHDKHGSYNEALFIPSLVKLLGSKYDCKDIAPRYKLRSNGNSFEADVIGVNDEYCYIVEIKSKLLPEAITQLETIIGKFKKYSSFYKNQAIVGMICAADYSEEMLNRTHRAGFLFVSIIDDLAKMKNPKGFKPKHW